MNQVATVIKEKILVAGPMRFDAFMDLALYAPNLGYYQTQVGMSGKDFITAPEMGALYQDALVDLIRYLGPASDQLIEIGPGTGRLMQGLKTSLANDFKHYGLVETSETLIEAQKALLGKNIRHYELNDIPVKSTIIANEWLDAIPSRRIKYKDGQCFEGYVDLKNDQFCWCWQLTDDLFPHWPQHDGIYDIRDHHAILAPLTNAIEGSVMIIVDYGYHAKELHYQPHLGDGLRGFCANQVVDDVLWNPGQMDITSDVNFTALAHACADLGWQVHAYFTQGHWIMDFLSRHQTRKDKPNEVKALTSPSEMGERVRLLVIADPKLKLPPVPYDGLARL